MLVNVFWMRFYVFAVFCVINVAFSSEFYYKCNEVILKNMKMGPLKLYTKSAEEQFLPSRTSCFCLLTVRVITQHVQLHVYVE